MYRRIIIISVIILAALCGLAWLGYRSIQIRAEGMAGTRLGEFAEVAEQIRQDVKRKLDEFIQTEQNRPYTDYQYYYVPQDVTSSQQQMPLLRSPLGGSIYNDLAYGSFQIEPDGRIVTPYYKAGEQPTQSKLARQAGDNLRNIELNLLPVLNDSSSLLKLTAADALLTDRKTKPLASPKDDTEEEEVAKKVSAKAKGARSRQYRIQSLEKQSQREQVLTQKRSVVADNVARGGGAAVRQSDSTMSSNIRERQMLEKTSEPVQMAERDLSGSRHKQPEVTRQTPTAIKSDRQAARLDFSDRKPPDQTKIIEEAPQKLRPQSRTERKEVYDLDEEQQSGQADTVQIRIEPFVPVVVGGADVRQSVFGGQVFMLRHVQIENRHLLQGFLLNEQKLLEEVEDSTQRFMREGMDFELSQADNPDAAYAAILDFGFGDLVVNLIEIDPAWIDREMGKLRSWYFGIIGIVFLAVMLGLVSLWRYARAQLKLAEKKDDFISAVSHELRTPLTSIRMYSEMLEKNWVKSDDKAGEYYKNMRQESERLTRLIENVLDFSRIQKGRKRYVFRLGDINKCITDVTEMMTSYAAQHGFLIRTDLEKLEQTAFDKDAVTQIVVNLLDNAVKYARDAEDKTIIVRSRKQNNFILIEVEDHGPGIPRRQREKVFEQFYRSGAEAKRESKGTGLGLALVRKFADAHNGFVEILNAKPTGAIFKVGLDVQNRA